MRVNRRLLYAGLFLAALGGVLVATDWAAVDTPTLADALRLWPLALVAVGTGLVLRRSRLAVGAGVLAAVLPGLVLGATLSVAPRFVGDCGVRGEPAVDTTEDGTFDRPAHVSVTGGCGSMAIRTAPGTGWRFEAGNSAGRVPTVRSSPGSLSIQSMSDEGWHAFDGGRQHWDLTLPTSEIAELTVVGYASRTEIDLAEARIGRLALTANASEVVVDASTASIANLSGVVNVGSMAIHLPAGGDLAGSLRIGGGGLRLCSPPDVGLRVTTRGSPRQVTVNGLRHEGSEWQSPDYASATHRADISVTVNFGAVEINPIGGCR
jgi:hypothetical protein